jgi:RNA polymerase sigma factor (sigma-70 family)
MEFAVDMEPRSQLSDDSLWGDVRRGDRDALATLFRRHGNTIYHYCFYRVGDWSAAEDMLSMVFLEAWRRRDADVEAGKVLQWFYGIATNVVRNRRRSDRRYAAVLRRLAPDGPTPDSADDAVARADDQRQMKRLLLLVSELPRRDQDVLALCLWSELSYDDAATALGVPVGTVRSRLSRARSRLRELDTPSGHQLDEPHVKEVLDQ